MMQIPDTQMGHIPHAISQPTKMPASSSRILPNVRCKVCKDHSSGKHYGIFACDGCAGFFKRSIRKSRAYSCKSKANGTCIVDKTHRNQCRACRLQKCLAAGMNRDAVQHERGPRNSTMKKAHMMTNLFYNKDLSAIPVPDLMSTTIANPSTALNLVVPKSMMSKVPPVTSVPVSSHQVYQPVYTRVSPIPTKEIPESRTPTSIPYGLSTLVCEQAAQLLFMNVHWVRELNANNGLCMEDQLTILESSWCELFLLAAAQWMPNLDPTPLLALESQSVGLAIEVRKFRDVILSFNSLRLDYHEYYSVMAMVLYKAGVECESIPSSRSSTGSMSPGASRLREPAAVLRLRDHAQSTLEIRMLTNYVGAIRFNQLLQLLPLLRSVSTKAIEEIFFKKVIYQESIETILRKVYTDIPHHHNNVRRPEAHHSSLVKMGERTEILSRLKV